MKQLTLTKKQKEHLLEMCRELFPKYKKLTFGSDIGDCGRWSMDFLCCTNHKCDLILEIHWFEFCYRFLIPKIYKTTNDRAQVIVDTWTCNPIDYIYDDFLAFKEIDKKEIKILVDEEEINKLHRGHKQNCTYLYDKKGNIVAFAYGSLDSEQREEVIFSFMKLKGLDFQNGDLDGEKGFNFLDISDGIEDSYCF